MLAKWVNGVYDVIWLEVSGEIAWRLIVVAWTSPTSTRAKTENPNKTMIVEAKTTNDDALTDDGQVPWLI
jgi:hypothetical protein